MTLTHHWTLEVLAEIPTTSATWWPTVARALDELDDRLLEDAAVDEGAAGAFADAVGREPSLANESVRLVADHQMLVERVRRLRRRVAEVAGDSAQAPAVAAELATLARAERTYRTRSRDLFWDSFVRDIGGE